jgi:ABC-type amino acid transport substrate-binding protein
MRPGLRRLGLLLLVPLAIACAGSRTERPREASPRPLVVGTVVDAPPYAFHRDGALVGLELDFATELGRELGRPIEVVALEWDDALDALARGRIDVLMGGVTRTAERERRFAFAEAYVRSALGAVVLRRDRRRFASRAGACDSPLNTAVVAGTTGEKRLQNRCPAMVPRRYPTAGDAVRELRQNRVDTVVHDGPVLAWYVAQNEAELEFLPLRDAEEPLAWAFRADDVGLRDRANALLVRLRGDGSLDRILDRWIPADARAR